MDNPVFDQRLRKLYTHFAISVFESVTSLKNETFGPALRLRGVRPLRGKSRPVHELLRYRVLYSFVTSSFHRKYFVKHWKYYFQHDRAYQRWQNVSLYKTDRVTCSREANDLFHRTINRQKQIIASVKVSAMSLQYTSVLNAYFQYLKAD